MCFKVSVIKFLCAYRLTFPSYFVGFFITVVFEGSYYYYMCMNFFFTLPKDFLSVLKPKEDEHIIYQNEVSLIHILFNPTFNPSDLLEFAVNQSCPIYTPGQIYLKYNSKLHPRLPENIHPHLKRIKCKLSKALSIHQQP